MQGKSPPVQVKEPYGNLDMITCSLSSCNPECTKYTCRYYPKECLAVYRERKKKIPPYVVWSAPLCGTSSGPTLFVKVNFNQYPE